MRSALLSNLGFVLQISGIFILFPIVISFINSEPLATVGLFIAAISFLVLGFLLNALCERKELSFKQSCTLVVIAFISLSLIGSIPYMYFFSSMENTALSISQIITDSIFESTSGFTTTGFSIISDYSCIPSSIILYRALTQFVGGVGIVLIMLAFFYPETKLKELSRSMGFGTNGKVKKTFMLIITIYCSYTVVMIITGFLSGYSDIINLTSFIFSALSTGGFTPVADITAPITQSSLVFIIPFSMVLGATNFVVLAGLFRGKMKGTLKEKIIDKIKAFFKTEITAFIIIAIVSIILVTAFFNLSPYDALFHVISAMSTTGFSYLPTQDFSNALKIFLTILMFIGGTSLSTAGGIKMYRLLLMIKAVKKTATDMITQQDSKVSLHGKNYSNSEVIQAAVLVILSVFIIVISSFVLTASGFSFVDSAFETTAALGTVGLSVGIAGPALALPLKWLFTILMIIGRVEILSLLVVFSHKKEPRNIQEAAKRKKQALEFTIDLDCIDPDTDD
ncbi:MAG: TrkH family potassium uptake protein [Crenarchaeota archaeon]|nr:TrkH family potassium uptake protein [Thermoproteota archaeon]